MRLLTIVGIGLVLLTSCAEDERRGIRLTPTSTVETGVRVLVDNCPGPSGVLLSVRDDVLWEIQSPTSTDVDEGDSEAAALDAVSVAQEPGLAEFLIGETPEDWTTPIPLEQLLEPGTRYTISTEPDGQSIDFSTPDLAPGLLWDGVGVAQFNPDLIATECSQPADVGAFARNILVLGALGLTAAAIVLVVLILLLFVVTRRFSRIRSVQKRATRDLFRPDAQRPKARSRN
ncbi:MAG: hypothetical protein ACI81L_000679 [Verrucomicrobiales bacterium]|jgi:hypothetical protein